MDEDLELKLEHYETLKNKNKNLRTSNYNLSNHIEDCIMWHHIKFDSKSSHMTIIEKMWDISKKLHVFIEK
jgi:hypothetical protein